MTERESGGFTPEIVGNVRDARNTLAKTAVCRIDNLGNADIILQRAAFNSVVRNLDAALAKLGGEA